MTEPRPWVCDQDPPCRPGGYRCSDSCGYERRPTPPRSEEPA